MTTSTDVAAVRAALAAAYAKGDVELGNWHDWLAFAETLAATTVVTPPVVVPPVVVPPVTAAWTPKVKSPVGLVFPFKPKTTSVVNGDLTITTAGQVVSGPAVTGNIIVKAPNVKLDNFVAKGLFGGPTGLTANVGILDGSSLDAGFQYSNTVLTGIEIKNSFDGAKAMGDTHFIDCWIHQLMAQPSRPVGGGAGNSAGGYTHNDGIQSSGGNNLSVLRCRIEDTGYNSGIFIDPDQGGITGVEVGDSFVQGGNFPFFATHSASATGAPIPHQLYVHGCMFGDASMDSPSWAGTSRVETERGIDIRWENNVDEDGNPLALNAPPRTVPRWRKTNWSYDGVVH